MKYTPLRVTMQAENMLQQEPIKRIIEPCYIAERQTFSLAQ